MKSCTEVPEGSIVFLRCGMDIPLEEGIITDPSRIEESRPTIDLLRTKKCKIIIANHLGRPKSVEPSLSAKPIAEYFEKIYNTHFVDAIIGDQVKLAIQNANPSDLIVIQNLRFDPREEKNDAKFAEELVALCTCVVQDAYANAHRNHASMVGVLDYKPGYSGLLLEKELNMISKLNNPQKPYVAIIGGAKADKLSTIKGLLSEVDKILVGGVLANTFLKASGQSVGDSKVDESGFELAKELLASGKIVLPVDAVVADSFSENANSQTQKIQDIRKGMILDIGPETQRVYVKEISNAKTIVWAGPIGVFEWEKFAEGTKTIASAVALSDAYSLAAGGDSGAALVTLGYKDNISHVSTGGGVTLELLEGHKLPAVEALEANQKKFFTS